MPSMDISEICQMDSFAQELMDDIIVMDMVIFRTIFFELLVFFTFTLPTLHFAY